jgi:predicted HTH domain antitoxin
MGYDVYSIDSPFYSPESRTSPSTESLPRAYRSLAIRAYGEERISERKLAELLGIDVEDLDDVLEPEEAEEVPVV